MYGMHLNMFNITFREAVLQFGELIYINLNTAMISTAYRLTRTWWQYLPGPRQGERLDQQPAVCGECSSGLGALPGTVPCCRRPSGHILCRPPEVERPLHQKLWGERQRCVILHCTIVFCTQVDSCAFAHVDVMHVVYVKFLSLCFSIVDIIMFIGCMCVYIFALSWHSLWTTN